MGNIEDAMARFTLGGEIEAVNIEWLALQPTLKGGGRNQVVEGHRQFKTIFLREEGIHIKDPQLAHRWGLDRQDQLRQIKVAPFLPEMFKDVGEQNRLAAAHRIRLDADQAQKRRHGAANPLANCFPLCGKIKAWRGQTTQDIDRHPGIGTGCKDCIFNRISQGAHTGRINAPIGQAGPPLFGGILGKLIDIFAFAPRIIDVDPRLEISGTQFGKLEQQVGQITLGINQNRRHAVERRLFQQAEAEPGLATAGHAHADGVGGQVAGIIVDGDLAALAAIQIILSAEVERT